MRLPNGYGSVYKLSGNRRKPWIARKTIEYYTAVVDGKEVPKQRYKTIGYYETQAEALQALANYNSNPYDIDASKVTFKELYEKWSAAKYEKIVDSRGYIAAYKIAEPIYNIRFVDIRADHMQDVIDNCGKNYPTLKNVKILFGQLYKYAMKNDIVSKDYSSFVEIGKANTESKRTPFTKKEIEKLFESVGRYDDVESILIMIYTGLRPGELIKIKISDINLEDKYIVGGIKTDAGKDRLIPINNKIMPFISAAKNSGNKYLLQGGTGKPFSYDKYLDHFVIAMNQLGMKHKPHDCRHTFATLMSNAGADTVSLQKIIGHASYNTTANTYTHKDIEQLKKAIDLI